MISGSLTQPELRRQLFSAMVRELRIIRSLEKRLLQKRFTKTYRNAKCKSAEKQAEDRAEAVEDIKDATSRLFGAWLRLPEVRQDKTLQMTGTALRFAADLARKPRRRKYLKNQLLLVE